MHILILEDEPLIAKNLAKMVLKLKPDSQIAGILQSVEETLNWIDNNPLPDLILSDIQLSDGVSFQALEKLSQPVPVIFTTAFDDFALRAFKINSVDYLLKPLDLEMLTEAFEKLDSIIKKYNHSEFLKGFADVLNGQEKEKFKNRFLFYSGMQMIPLDADNIAAFIKLEIIFAIEAGGKQYITEYRSLDEIQEIIDPDCFFRANRQTLINRRYVKQIKSDDSNKIHVLTNIPGLEEVMVSKDKASEFKRWLGK
jgi:DNA-binding LytR/AlgR family response regulator